MLGVFKNDYISAPLFQIRPVIVDLPRHITHPAFLRCVVAPLRETFFCLSRNVACHSMGKDFPD